MKGLRAKLQVLAAADLKPEDEERHSAMLLNAKKALASKLHTLANKAAAGENYEEAVAMQSQVRAFVGVTLDARECCGFRSAHALMRTCSHIRCLVACHNLRL